MRQLVYTIFISNNHTSFHLWWKKKKLVKHRKVSKYCENDCRNHFWFKQDAVVWNRYCFVNKHKASDCINCLNLKNLTTKLLNSNDLAKRKQHWDKKYMVLLLLPYLLKILRTWSCSDTSINFQYFIFQRFLCHLLKFISKPYNLVSLTATMIIFQFVVESIMHFLLNH